METRICSDEKCEHNGEPQPISAFNIHGRSKQPMKICKECQRRRIQEGKEKRGLAGKPAAGAGSQRAAPEQTKIENIPVVNFADHPDLLARIKATAVLEYRTPADQLLWMVKSYVSPMEPTGEVKSLYPAR